MTTKLVDGKGRITLGPRFANKTVIVEEVDETEIRIIAAAVVPEREMWLQRNRHAKTAVLRGLKQARTGKISRRPPDLVKDSKLAEQLDD
jgi:hypothetical protein